MKVSHLQLKKGLFVPGLPQFNPTITQQHYPGIDMNTHELGILCKYKGHSFIVKDFDCAVVQEEAASASKAPKKA